MEPLVIISHNYQDGPTQEISDFVFGTTGIIRNANRFKGKRVLFCGVIYMAEDLYNVADGEVEVFIPEITVKDGVIDKPRCPMIKKQKGTEIVTMDHVEEARRKDPDIILAYINTPSSIKAECDGVYNGTVGLKVAEKIARERDGKGKVALVGDVNINDWIRDVIQPKFPELEIISVPTSDIQCPSHVNISPDFFIETYNELEKLHGEDLGLEMHAEVDTPLRRFGFEKNAYFGGTGGLVRTPQESDKTTWLVATVEGVVDRLKRESNLAIYSLNMRCPNMSYTTVQRVQKARMILETGEPIADIRYTLRDQPYYEIEIHDENHMQDVGGGRTRIPGVRLSVSEDISKGAKRALKTLL